MTCAAGDDDRPSSNGSGGEIPTVVFCGRGAAAKARDGDDTRSATLLRRGGLRSHSGKTLDGRVRAVSSQGNTGVTLISSG